MRRLYEQIVAWHLANDKQMLFLAGPRQVGKTTISQAASELTEHFVYMNWDRQLHKQVIIQGVDSVATFANLAEPRASKPILVFDEIHKYAKWKNFLKGFFDTYKNEVNIIVTGSAKLDIYKKGSDSLMGRYFPYRVHPFSVAECVHTDLSQELTRPATCIDEGTYAALWEFGGFPEPFTKQSVQFYRRWSQTRKSQLFEEDIRTLTQMQETSQIELLADILYQQVGDLLNKSTLAKKVNVAATTISRWLVTLENFYYLFMIKPWTKNVTRSLLKDPKMYLWDWSSLEDNGKRAENFIASHLLKAIHYWKDTGLGEFELYFLRDKEKREVDFFVVKDNQPWFLVEAKHSDNRGVSPALYRFQEQLNVPHAFQVIIDKPYVDIDCFNYTKPVIVPAKTFLSQLI